MLAGPDEHVGVDVRRHSVVLARPLALALVLAAAGVACLPSVSPLPLVGAAALTLAALIALRAVWRWERTHVVVTSEKVFVVEGTLRRRAAAVQIGSLESLVLEQSLTGRLFGYGTILAGPLELAHVPEARRVYGVLERLAASTASTIRA